MLGNVGQCWAMLGSVRQCSAMLGNVEWCWQLFDITKAAARLCVPAIPCVTLLREALVYYIFKTLKLYLWIKRDLNDLYDLSNISNLYDLYDLYDLSKIYQRFAQKGYTGECWNTKASCCLRDIEELLDVITLHLRTSPKNTQDHTQRHGTPPNITEHPHIT